ncbi:hypothetical protein [Azotobacter beijerinckii]|uniref:Uncharacterized protein n=1 Tax=Azotobacter beijerinckii TaxID=170623 RepID=A0A1I3ZG52_9GAMM|nr:hypothetical protein [Azotobacter beijerinckii]SFB14522.1 hypothetical protein SAMN04244571_01566 [Azotobacter beijerinckii]SFK42972.1 hypothetical protein SAMN04244574_00588 [Azotobacter beijerinckii]
MEVERLSLSSFSWSRSHTDSTGMPDSAGDFQQGSLVEADVQPGIADAQLIGGIGGYLQVTKMEVEQAEEAYEVRLMYGMCSRNANCSSAIPVLARV